MYVLPQPNGTEDYQMIPFQFTEELSSKNVFVRLPDSFSPLERMILQASGNLQRLISAYYNVPSHVEIIYNKVIPNSPPPQNTTTIYTPTVTNGNGPYDHHHGNGNKSIHTQYDRKTRIYFDDKMAYEADSILYVKDQNVLDLIEKHKYGLGQIFGHTKRSPDFMLLAVGRHGSKPGSSFWRDYSLRIPDVLDCFIRETFVEGLFNDCQPFVKDQDRGNGTIWYNSPLE